MLGTITLLEELGLEAEEIGAAVSNLGDVLNLSDVAEDIVDTFWRAPPETDLQELGLAAYGGVAGVGGTELVERGIQYISDRGASLGASGGMSAPRRDFRPVYEMSAPRRDFRPIALDGPIVHRDRPGFGIFDTGRVRRIDYTINYVNSFVTICVLIVNETQTWVAERHVRSRALGRGGTRESQS